MLCREETCSGVGQCDPAGFGGRDAGRRRAEQWDHGNSEGFTGFVLAEMEQKNLEKLFPVASTSSDPWWWSHRPWRYLREGSVFC